MTVSSHSEPADDDVDTTVEDIEAEGPSPEDYVKTSCGKLGANTCVGEVEGQYVGEFDDDVTADQAICERMNEKKFWPNVWTLSDHGNLSLDEDFKCERPPEKDD